MLGEIVHCSGSLRPSLIQFGATFTFADLKIQSREQLV